MVLRSASAQAARGGRLEICQQHRYRCCSLTQPNGSRWHSHVGCLLSPPAAVSKLKKVMLGGRAHAGQALQLPCCKTWAHRVEGKHTTDRSPPTDSDCPRQLPPCAAVFRPAPPTVFSWAPAYGASGQHVSLASPGRKPWQSGSIWGPGPAQNLLCHCPGHSMGNAGRPCGEILGRAACHRSSPGPCWQPAMASGGEKPRALVLSADDRTVVVTRLARSVLRFQDDFLSRDSSPAGLLCQAGRRWGALPWLPVLHVGSQACRTAAAYATDLGAVPKPPTPCARSRCPALPSRKRCARCWLQVWLPDVVEDNQIVLKTKVGTAVASGGHPAGQEGFVLSGAGRRLAAQTASPSGQGAGGPLVHRYARLGSPQLPPARRRPTANLGCRRGFLLSNRRPPPPCSTLPLPACPAAGPLPAHLLAGHALLCGGHRRPASPVPLHLLPLCVWHYSGALKHAGGARPRLHIFRGGPGGVAGWLG
jgi:hypothetical protein